MFDFQPSRVEGIVQPAFGAAKAVSLDIHWGQTYCENAMAIPVILPRQGQSVETCAILAWKKRVGDPVKTGDVLCEIETDKATFELESPADGTLIAIFHEAGSQVPVLATIAAIGKPGEKADGLKSAGGGAAVQAPTQAPATASQPPAQPLAQPVAQPADVAAGKIMASPRAKALAAANGLALSGLHGTGPGGRIIERDVKEALGSGAGPAGRPVQPAAAATAGGAARAFVAAPARPGSVREIKVTGIRKLIAERMLASLSTTAQLTLNSSADARVLQDLRGKFKESPETLGLRGVTINDMVLFAASRALLQHEDLNAHFTGDMIRQYADVHLGFAIDTPRGLMVPVIKNAQSLSLRAMAQEAGRLIAACREGRIMPDEMSGGTFTVTNLGGLGIESFTPVLNVPQVGILGVGSIVPRAVQGADGSMTFIPQIGLSLTVNHQAVDGAPGARFLQTLAGLIARFDLLLAQ